MPEDSIIDEPIEDGTVEAEDVDSNDESQMLWPSNLITETPISNKSRIVISPEGDNHSTPNQILKKYWGYDDFRPLQKDIIDSILAGNDTLGLMPTGGGKSITFQVPALILEGLTLIITPLISLMKDQVDHLRSRGIKATAIHSGMNSEAIGKALDNCIFGNYKLLYISPERLMSERFVLRIKELDIALIVVDECHCICQWGYDFRPSYLKIIDIRPLFPKTPILALTATATPDVIIDIQQQLGFMANSRFLQKSFFRPNLSYSIRRTDNKEEMMLYILRRVKGSSIIYCRSRQLCRDIASFLKKNQISATYFHAGLTHKEREMRQERWMKEEIRVMVATNAFGMGIDKPNVRLVIHYIMPSSLEEYFQEAGRAGRDGEQSYAVAIVGRSDASLLQRRLQDTFPPREYIRITYDKLCNYFAIGEGEGAGTSHDIDLELFLIRFRMRPVQTRSAISILDAAGLISFNEQQSRSRLKFLMTREQLYNDNVGFDFILRAILRTYTGVFSDYVFISESELSLNTGMTQQEIYALLTAMSQRDIIHYIPKSNLPRITFLRRREDSAHIVIPRNIYEERKIRMQNRIQAVINYIEDYNTCRSTLLLNYFGEKANQDCGHCDICLNPDKSNTTNETIATVYLWLKDLLIDKKKKSITIKELASEFNLSVEDAVRITKQITYYSKELTLFNSDTIIYKPLSF